PGSGTAKGRAILPNPNGFLKPGMVGRLQLAGSAAYRALLVPDAAVVTDASRRLIYVVDGGGAGVAKAVERGPATRHRRVIRSGLDPKDNVIVGGMQRARPGQKVQARKGTIQPAAARAPAAAAPRAPQASAAEIVAPAKN